MFDDEGRRGVTTCAHPNSYVIRDMTMKCSGYLAAYSPNLSFCPLYYHHGILYSLQQLKALCSTVGAAMLIPNQT